MTELLHPELTGISRRLVLALCTLPGNTAEEAENNYAEIYDNDSFKAYNVSTRMLVSGAFKITEDLQRKVKGYRRYQYLKNTYTLCLKEKFSARVKAAVMDYLSGNFAALVKAAKGELTFSDLGGMDEVLMEHLPHDISGFTLECGAGNSDSLDFPDDILTKKSFSRLYCHIVRNFSWKLRKHPQQLFTFMGFNLNRLKFYPGDGAGEALGRINALYYPQINDPGMLNKLIDGRLKAKDIKEPADQRSLTLEEFNLDDFELASCKDTLLKVAAVSPEIQTLEYAGSFFFYSEPELRDYPGPTHRVLQGSGRYAHRGDS